MIEWKAHQAMYQLLMSRRHTDLIEVHQVTREDDVSIDAANKYINTREMFFQQPTKSRLIAITYAHLLCKHYPGLDFYTVLDDPELLLDDQDFKPYNQAKDQYDKLIHALSPIENWINKKEGWMTRTQQYFWLECTESGSLFTSFSTNEQMHEFLESTDTSRSL